VKQRYSELFLKNRGSLKLEFYRLVNYDDWKNEYFRKVYIDFMTKKFQEIGFQVTNIKWPFSSSHYGYMLELKWNIQMDANKKSLREFFQYYCDEEEKKNLEKERQQVKVIKRKREKAKKKIPRLFQKIKKIELKTIHKTFKKNDCG
jgi:hypothetical protein